MTSSTKEKGPVKREIPEPAPTLGSLVFLRQPTDDDLIAVANDVFEKVKNITNKDHLTAMATHYANGFMFLNNLLATAEQREQVIALVVRKSVRAHQVVAMLQKKQEMANRHANNAVLRVRHTCPTPRCSFVAISHDATVPDALRFHCVQMHNKFGFALERLIVRPRPTVIVEAGPLAAYRGCNDTLDDAILIAYDERDPSVEALVEVEISGIGCGGS